MVIDADQFGATAREVRLHLESQNIESRPVWKPMHCQPVFEIVAVWEAKFPSSFSPMVSACPVDSPLTPSDIERVVSAFLSVPRRRARRPVSVSVEA